MNQTLQESPEGGSRGQPAPIRNPEEFLDAVDRALALLSRVVEARRRNESGTDALAEEALALSEAVAAAPFQMRGRDVVAKGFLPRIVR